MSQKYRQPGYQDSGDSSRKESPGPRPKREGPRSPQMPGFHEVMRCSQCGFQLPPAALDIEFSSRCPKCSAALHSCRNCAYFDPGSRMECTQEIPKRISPKDAGNQCQFFSGKTAMEKVTTGASGPRPEDAREAFERLFKK